MADNPAQDLATLWSTNETRFKPSRDKIEECGQWERGEVRPTLPLRMVNGKQVPQGFPVVLPHATTMPQDVAAFVARKEPSLKRTPLGEGSRAERDASNVERWLQEAFASKVMIEGKPLWKVLTSIATHDSEYAVLVQPAQSAYKGVLSLHDDDGQISATWQRATDGRDREEYGTGFKVNRKRSRMAYESYMRNFKAKRWPILVRVLSAPEYQPLGRDALTGQLDTLLIKTQCTAAHLKTQGFEWWAHDYHSSSDPGSAKSFTLYELHTTGPWRIVYQIDGLNGDKYQATKDGNSVQLGLDMGAEYGFHRLLAGQFFGWNRAHEKDPSKRGIPLLSPFLGILGGAQRQISGIIEHNWRTGFGSWGYKIEPEMLDAWIEMGKPTQFHMLEDTIHPLLGTPVSLVHQGAGPDAWRVFEFLMGLVERFNEGERVRSNPDASSIAQTTTAASTDTVLSDIADGALQGVQFVAEAMLEVCAALSEKTGGPIPIYCHVNAKGEEQTHVELSAKELMGDFRVDVEQPTKKWGNLPLAQAGAGWQARGLVGKYEWRQDFAGDPQPEEGLDKIAAEQYVDSEEGQAELHTEVARVQGDRRRIRIQDLQSNGDLSQGMTPTAALPPRPGGQTGMGQDGVPPTNGLSQAQASVMGQTAAAVNPGAVTNVVTATGAGPAQAPV